VVRPLAIQFAVGRGRQAAALRPFLQGRLGVAGIGLDGSDPRIPESQDDGLRGLEAGVEIDRRDHRLHRVGKERLLAPAARHHLRPAELQDLAEVRLARDGGAGLLADEGIEARRELALAGPPVGGQKRLGHDEAEHAVAEEFKPLVVGACRRGDGGMRDRAQKKFGPAELMPDAGREGLEVRRQSHSTAVKKRSDRQVQKKKSERPAEENMIRSARPMRYSAGSIPTPPEFTAKRLSWLLSRLSPMKK